MKGLKSFGRYGSLGFELLASMAVGYYLGLWADKKLGTRWLALVGFLIGCYAGFRALLPPDEGGSGRVLWAVLAVVKMLLLFGGIWLLLTTGKVAPIGLVVGYGVLPLGMVAAALWPKPRPKD